MKRNDFLSIKAVKRTVKISDQLYDAIEFVLQAGLLTMSLHIKSEWIHLRDAVCCGTASPMDAYECLQAGYVFEELKVRTSNYAHLIC